MKIAVDLILDCGHKYTETKEYNWTGCDQRTNEVEIAKYENYINFRRVGLNWYCIAHNKEFRIVDVNIHVVEFDARREIV